MTRVGIEAVVAEGFRQWRGRSLGLVVNQASILSDFQYTLDVVRARQAEGGYRLAAIFGPQHGLSGHTQDNMIEWEGETGSGEAIPIHSLYGQVREPTDAMLADIDTLVIDLPDVGARYYTFIWTMALCMKAASERGIEVVVLDRPNPLGGAVVEGPRMKAEMESFVGLFPIVARHGLTIGEVAKWLQATHYPSCKLEVVPMTGWNRRMFWSDTERHWVMPSPNMPTLDTALVYPGMCLFEGTKLSEGRGTTRPFEICGAPYVDAEQLVADMHQLDLPGVRFRPYSFEPTFQKHAREVCHGLHFHVTDREKFRSVETTFHLLRILWRNHGKEVAWQDPPYEYVWDRRPIDLLTGDPELTSWIEENGSQHLLQQRLQDDAANWMTERKPFLLYS